MTKYTKTADEYTTVYATVINNIPVTITLENEIEAFKIDFEVNNSFEKADLSRRDKVAITRWIKAVWEEIKDQHNAFVCYPYLDAEEKENDLISSGEEPSWRGMIYSKMGFKPQDYGTFVDFCMMTYTK